MLLRDGSRPLCRCQRLRRLTRTPASFSSVIVAFEYAKHYALYQNRAASRQRRDGARQLLPMQPRHEVAATVWRAPDMRRRGDTALMSDVVA